MHLQNDISCVFEHISTLLDNNIPQQSKNLSDNVFNLEKVAQYCEDIYVNSKEADKQQLLNETKGYTTQALASVAYQIYVLANSFLDLLENQSVALDDMSVSMSHLAHEVNIHKEKVARREIGILTTNKCVLRTVKVKRPDIDEKPVKYVRKPIDYSLLDDIGHGVKLSRQSSNSDPLLKLVGRQNSYSSTHSSGSNSTTVTTAASSILGKPDIPTPPLMLKANAILNVNSGSGLNTVRSTISSASTYYRTPVMPPSVPSEYLSRQELGIYSSKKELNQSANDSTTSYGGPSLAGYRRPSQLSNMNNNSNSEYSGSDTLDRRATNHYLQQLGYASNPNNSIGAQNNINLNNSLNGSIGYASSKEIGIIRTNLNNIDYASNGTMYRRPQLPNSAVYERSMSGGSNSQLENNNVYSSNGQTRTSGQQHNSYQYSRNDSQKGMVNLPANNKNYGPMMINQHLMHGIPPPNNLYSSGVPNPDMNENQINLDYGKNNYEDSDDIIPSWVPIDRCIEKVVTTYDYEGLRDDELSFKENMIIYVIKKNDDHWYEGIMQSENGEIVTGLYPYNYARCIRKYLPDDPRISQC